MTFRSALLRICEKVFILSFAGINKPGPCINQSPARYPSQMKRIVLVVLIILKILKQLAAVSSVLYKGGL